MKLFQILKILKHELKKYTSYSKDDIIILSAIRELKEFSRRIIIKFQYGIFDTDLYRKEYPDRIDSWLIELKPEQLHNLEIVDNYANHYDYGLYSHDDRNAI